jgi:Mannitol-1-phosphate/altronate dehydrogenases
MTERILQFGEGNFLRGFVDYFVHLINEKCAFDGSVIVVQPIAEGRVSDLNRQGGVYNLFLRGCVSGEEIVEHTEIRSISRGIDLYADYAAFLETAGIETLRFIVSNTTEAGIEYIDGDVHSLSVPPKSYPAKLTIFLYERFKRSLPGFVLFPCELIDNNADVLRECVIKYAAKWNLGDDFIKWLAEENHFCNTLVDRIVTGYPQDEAAALIENHIGYEDKLIDTGEIFHLWVIQGDFEDEFPLRHAGINAVWTDDVTPYKKRKVRLLNGAHTSLVPASMLCGLSTVGEAVDDAVTGRFLQKCLFDEIIPSLDGTVEGADDFANSVLDRFRNPYIKHRLESIALNSISKFKVRVLPSIIDYHELNGELPKLLTLSFAALIALYKDGFANDTPEQAEFIKANSIADILSNTQLWDVDLLFMSERVQLLYNDIMSDGIYETIKRAIA